MAEPKKPAPPITNVDVGKIKVIVSGGINVTSNDPRVVIERK